MTNREVALKSILGGSVIYKKHVCTVLKDYEDGTCKLSWLMKPEIIFDHVPNAELISEKDYVWGEN